MPLKPAVAPNEALFNSRGELVRLGEFFPPQLIAPTEDRLFILPPAPELIELVTTYPAKSPQQKARLEAGGSVYSLLLGLRRLTGSEYISVKTIPWDDWEMTLNLQPGFKSWLDGQTDPMMLIDCCGFMLYGNPASRTLLSKTAKGTKAVLFWELLDEGEVTRQRQLWGSKTNSQGQNAERYERVIAIRDERGGICAWLIHDCQTDVHQEELEAWGQRLALAHAEEGLILLDKFGFISYTTPNCAELMGLGDVNLTGRRLISLVIEGSKNLLLAQMLRQKKVMTPIIVKMDSKHNDENLIQLEPLTIPVEIRERTWLALRVKAARELIQREDREARLNLLDELQGYENAPLIACFSTKDDSLLYISPNCQSWSGIASDQFHRNPWKFWQLFPLHAFQAESEQSFRSNDQTETYHTILERTDGTVVPVKVQIIAVPLFHRKHIIVQVLDSLALGDEYAAFLNTLVGFNQSCSSSEQICAIASHLATVTQSEQIIVNIFDAITGLVIRTIVEPEAEADDLNENRIPPDLLPYAFATTYLAQSIQQQQANGTMVTRIPLTHRQEVCGELFLLARSLEHPYEADLSPWLHFLGVAIAFWRYQQVLEKEGSINRILNFGMGRVLVPRLNGVTVDLARYLASSEIISPDKLNRLTKELDGLLVTLHELMLFATVDYAPPQAELIDLESLLKELGVELIDRLSQDEALLTVDHGLPQVVASRDYLRLIFSRLIEFAISQRDTGKPLRMNITAHLLPQATRILFRCNILELPDDDCQRVLEPFYQSRIEPTDLDLGLALVKKTVETIGGQITVVKEKPDLTVFSILLPHRP